MTLHFPRIGLMGRHTNPEVRSTLASLVTFLRSKKVQIIMDQHCARLMPSVEVKSAPRETIASECDLVIVVGGDGSLLEAARNVVDAGIPVSGVNRGRRGFLTDISPQALTQSLEPLLRGAYREESRFLLEMKLWRKDQLLGSSCALNDVVLYSGDISRVMEFEVYINQQFVQRLRSDGIITATPTGSTAHALAGGGPILSPSLKAIVLVPMHPTVLSSRSIVVDDQGIIELHLTSENLLHPRVSCDGQVHFDVQAEDKIIICRKAKELRLLHPLDYDYYHTLRTKLGWTN